MKRIFIIILITFSFLNCLAFPIDTVKINKRYIDFLSEPGEKGQATMLTASYTYLYSPWGKTFQTGGMHPTIGLNLARFISNKIILGVFVDLKGIKGFTQQKFSKEFVNDFNQNFIAAYSNSQDSARAYTVKDAINNVSQHSFSGNYYGDIGIMFSPFPQKFGGLMVSVKKGYRNYPIFGTYGNKFIRNGEAENVSIDFSKTYAFSITLKPSTFFKQGNIHLDEIEGSDFWQFVTIGFYYERLNIKNATFDKMYLDQIVNQSFVSKYSIDKRFGVTLGFAIY